MIMELTPTQSRELAKIVAELSPMQKADFYYFTLIENQDPYEFLDSLNFNKHLAGQHDQSSHGSWALDTFEDLEVWSMRSNEALGSTEDERESFYEKAMSQQINAGYDVGAYPEYKRPLELYLSSEYKLINEALRDPLISTQGIEGEISDLDEVINNAPTLESPLLAYRGVNDSMTGFFGNLKVGDVFEDKGFVSTTLDPEIAHQFTGSSMFSKILQFHLPKGTKGLFPEYFLGDEVYSWKEREFLLPRDSKFKVTQIRGSIIDVEITQ
jgi:hypothetical protein